MAFSGTLCLGLLLLVLQQDVSDYPLNRESGWLRLVAQREHFFQSLTNETGHCKASSQ